MSDFEIVIVGDHDACCYCSKLENAILKVLNSKNFKMLDLDVSYKFLTRSLRGNYIHPEAKKLVNSSSKSKNYKSMPMLFMNGDFYGGSESIDEMFDNIIP